MKPFTLNPNGLLTPSYKNNNKQIFPPYFINQKELFTLFGTSPRRLLLLENLLLFRKELHSIGLTKGTQWIGGSFVEKKRDPTDIDITTFHYCPEGSEMADIYCDNWEMFDKSITSDKYEIDSSFELLDREDFKNLSDRIAYWCGLFGHTRQGSPKGFIQVDLSP